MLITAHLLHSIDILLGSIARTLTFLISHIRPNEEDCFPRETRPHRSHFQQKKKPPAAGHRDSVSRSLSQRLARVIGARMWHLNDQGGAERTTEIRISGSHTHEKPIFAFRWFSLIRIVSHESERHQQESALDGKKTLRCGGRGLSTCY